MTRYMPQIWIPPIEDNPGYWEDMEIKSFSTHTLAQVVVRRAKRREKIIGLEPGVYRIQGKRNLGGINHKCSSIIRAEFDLISSSA